mmetsp:Transcript_48188/g.111678  ORF Transcript_48188/g.111678 Transcript_48188/m.111678 type:complete len:201 (+) Transcript_48188:302-904(+)
MVISCPSSARKLERFVLSLLAGQATAPSWNEWRMEYSTHCSSASWPCCDSSWPQSSRRLLALWRLLRRPTGSSSWVPRNSNDQAVIGASNRIVTACALSLKALCAEMLSSSRSACWLHRRSSPQSRSLASCRVRWNHCSRRSKPCAQGALGSSLHPTGSQRHRSSSLEGTSRDAQTWSSASIQTGTLQIQRLGLFRALDP